MVPNLLASVNWAKVSLTVGWGCTTHCTFPFNGFRLTQIHIVPVLFGKTTTPVDQGVGCSNFEITCIDSIWSNSCFTLVRRGMGTCWGVKIVNGLAPSFSLIVYFSPQLPKPWKSDRKFVITLQFDELVIDSTLTARFKALIACNPSKFWTTTYTDCMVSLSHTRVSLELSDDFQRSLWRSIQCLLCVILIGGFQSFGRCPVSLQRLLPLYPA